MDVDTEKKTAPGKPYERKGQTSPLSYSLEIPGSGGQKVVIFVPPSFSAPSGFNPEVTRHLSGAYTEAFGIPDQDRELRLHQRVGNRLGQLLKKVERNLQLMAEKQEPRDQTIVVWKQTGDPRQDFVDRTIYLLLMSSGLQFKDPISLPPSQGRRREVVESQYHQSSLVEKTNFPGVLALVEESVFEPRGPKKQEELLGRTISLQLFSHGEWNKIQAKSTE